MAYPKQGKMRRVASKHKATFHHAGTPMPTRDFGSKKEPMDTKSIADRAQTDIAQREPYKTPMSSPDPQNYPDPTLTFMQSRMGF